MSVKFLSYLDLSPEQRAKGAAEVRQRLVAAMSSPFLPPDQQAHYQQEMERINLWEAGRLPVPVPPPAPKPASVPRVLPAVASAPVASVAHAVDIQEKLSVIEEK